MTQSGIQPTHRPTLQDIAQRANVSISAASLVLSGKANEHRLSDAVIERVQHAALDLGHAPNLLVRPQTHVLSFYNGFRNRDRNDLYMDQLSTAIGRASGKIGYDLRVYCDFRRTVEEAFENLSGGLGDGLLFFAPPPDEPLLPLLRSSRLPTVLIGTDDPANVLSSVREDMVSGMAQVAEHLASCGHQRIAALTTVPGGNADADQRTSLLQKGLAEHGISIPDRWMIPTDDLQPADAQSALRFLMSEPEPPTALFCWHDRKGYQILEQCEALGIAVPDQLSLVGYDGLHWPARTRHSLASVSVDLEVLATFAVSLLDSLVTGAVQSPVKQIIPVTLSLGTTLAAASS